MPTPAPPSSSTASTAACSPATPQVASGSGNITAVPRGTYNYQQTPINLSAYTSGTLVITIQLGNGASAGSFDLFAGPNHPATVGSDKGLGGGPIIPGAYDKAPGSTSTLSYKFGANNNHQLVFGAEGNWFSQAGSQNTYTFTAVVQNATPAGAGPSPPACPPPAAAPVVSNLITSVSIQNSPGVPDTGGHCIICGLVVGNLTAVEPNLVICLTPTGAPGGQTACSDICAPGHDCKKPFFMGLTGSNRSVHVKVFDNDKEGKVQKLAEFDESDAAQCTAAQPCKVNDSDDQSAGTLVSFEFGDDPCTLPPAGAANTVTAATSQAPKTFSGPVLGSKNAVTFKPTNTTQVYNSNVIEVQTGMSGAQGNGNCDALKTCNGITIHASAGLKDVHFVQFFYRQAYDVNGNLRDVTSMNGGGINGKCVLFSPQSPQNCYETTVDARAPNWVPDAGNRSPVASPYYTPDDVINDSNGDGVTMFDTPTFDDQVGFDNHLIRWVFQGRDFVMSNGSVIACVDWTLQHGVNMMSPPATETGYVGPYSNVRIVVLNTPASKLPAAFAKALDAYDIPDPIAQYLLDSGQSVVAPEPAGP
jgi:hypothetical protein